MGQSEKKQCRTVGPVPGILPPSVYTAPRRYEAESARRARQRYPKGTMESRGYCSWAVSSDAPGCRTMASAGWGFSMTRTPKRRYPVRTPMDTLPVVSQRSGPENFTGCPPGRPMQSMSSHGPTSRGKRSLVIPIDAVPIDDLKKGGNVFGASILIFQIVGMFPNVQSQNRNLSLADGIVLIRRGHNFQAAVAGNDPCPPASKEQGCR